MGIAQQLIDGLSVTSILILGALGLGITFGVMKVLNMAHGELIMVGAYSMYIFNTVLGIPFFIGIIFSFMSAALIGLLIEKTVIRRLYGRPLETLLATFGLSIILQQLVKIIFGTGGKSVQNPLNGTLHMGEIVFPYYRMMIILVAVFILLITSVVMFKTNFGIQLRSVSQNRQMSESLGIDTSKVDMLTFAFGSGIAGVAGAMLAPIRSISPTMGFEYLIDSFMVIVLGGVGSLLGIFSGSLITGEFNQLLTAFTSETSAKILVFLLIIIIIRFKPSGLFGKEGR